MPRASSRDPLSVPVPFRKIRGPDTAGRFPAMKLLLIGFCHRLAELRPEEVAEVVQAEMLALFKPLSIRVLPNESEIETNRRFCWLISKANAFW